MAERDTYIIEMIVLNCDEILSFISGMSYYDFREDRKTQNACAMSVINLGELVSVISKDTKRNHPEVEWSGIHKFRSKTAHTYYDQKRYIEKDKIDVNKPYMIPSWEVPEALSIQLQTFLHRALWRNSEDVFKFLLDKGANPRIEGHCHDTVIGNLFDCKEEDFLKFGKMLVDAGMTVSEIQQRAKYRNDKSGVLKLIKYATNATFDSRNSRIACKSSSDNRKKIPFTVLRQR